MLLYCSNTELGPFLPFHSFILWLSLFFTLSFSLLFISLFLCLLYMFVCVCVCVWHIFLTNRKLYVYVQPITNPYTKLKNYLSCGETERERGTWIRGLCVCVPQCADAVYVWTNELANSLRTESGLELYAPYDYEHYNEHI